MGHSIESALKEIVFTNNRICLVWGGIPEIAVLCSCRTNKKTYEKIGYYGSLLFHLVNINKPPDKKLLIYYRICISSCPVA